jgi:hypothetical protein
MDALRANPEPGEDHTFAIAYSELNSSSITILHAHVKFSSPAPFTLTQQGEYSPFVQKRSIANLWNAAVVTTNHRFCGRECQSDRP